MSHACCTWRGLVGRRVFLWIKDSTFAWLKTLEWLHIGLLIVWGCFLLGCGTPYTNKVSDSASQCTFPDCFIWFWGFFFWSDKAGLPPTCMYIYNAPQKRKIYLQKKKLSCALRWWMLDVLSFKETLLTMSSEASAEWATNASGEGGCLFLGRNCKIGKKSVNGVFSVRGLTFSLFIRNTTDNIEPNQCWLSHPCCTWRGLVGSQVLLWIKDSTFELACEKKP